MREETHTPRKICAFCKQPITPKQEPAVQLKNGDLLHIECYQKREIARRGTN